MATAPDLAGVGGERDGEVADDGKDGAASGAFLVLGIVTATFDAGLASFLAQPEFRECATLLCVTHDEAVGPDAIVDTLRDRGVDAVAACDGLLLAAGQVVVAPRDEGIIVDGDRIGLRGASGSSGQRGRGDELLLSIAEAYRDRAVGILIHPARGMATLGLAALKEHGGLCVVEGMRPSDNHLAASPVESIADYLLSRTEIAPCVAHYRAHIAGVSQDASAPSDQACGDGRMDRLADILRDTTGHDFHGYKSSTFLRRVRRRMQVRRIDDADDYIARLEQDEEEVRNLFNDLLIGVTQFFRDPAEFALLERSVLPRLFENKGADDHLRIWVVGCATGEEAYTLAILLREYMEQRDSAPTVRIFATDIDGGSLAQARVGRYSAQIEKDLSSERLARWFVREGDTYCVNKELRAMCIFSEHNMLRDAPLSRIDLISCRNLLIFLGKELQDRVVPIFHYALRPDGYLFLGTSENLSRHARRFRAIDRRGRIFKRMETEARLLSYFPLTAGGGQPRKTVRAMPPVTEANLARRAERIADRYAPAYVIVDESFAILHFSGRMGRYLDPTRGAASLSLPQLAHPDLRLDIRAALQAARERQEVVRPPLLAMEVDGSIEMVRLTVEPIDHKGEPARNFIVLFQAADLSGQRPEHSAKHSLRDDDIQRLESELRQTRDRLHAANEELKSSNEEYQSINEELQSANEELEASKEEVHSVNEELRTVNTELNHRVEELARTNSDHRNLLESTQIATVFLDNDLRVRSFTPAVTDIFHLIDNDVGRPIAHIAGKISFETLLDDVRKVMRTLTSVEREVGDARSGDRYLVRILPYRSADNFIAGVVLTFLDISDLARAEAALRESDERFRVMAKSVPIELFTATPDLEWDYVTARFGERTGMDDGAALGHGWMAAVHPDDLERTRRGWLQAGDNDGVFQAELRLRNSAGGFRWMQVRAEAVRDQDGAIARWYGSASDIDDLRSATEHQKLLTSELQHRVKNILAVVRSIFSRSLEADYSVDHLADHFRGRIDALARTQTVLAHAPQGEIELEDLIRDELLSVEAPMDGPRIRISGPAVRLGHKPAETLGLAVHELVTNAVKYGALSADRGQIDIGWHVEAAGAAGASRLHFVWAEKGVRIVSGEPPRDGFGSDLIENGLPYQLGATTAFELLPGGVRCVINLSLDADGADMTIARKESA